MPFGLQIRVCNSICESSAPEEKNLRSAMETDLDDYTVIKEGEAEVLMHKKNQVFFNKAQVFIFAFVFVHIGFELLQRFFLFGEN